MRTIDFVAAKLKHNAWKSKMRRFINGETSMTESQAVSHHDCELGKWLYSDGKTNFGRLTEFRELENIHAKLHGNVRNIISKKNAGDISGAEDQYKELEMASGKVIHLLDELDAKVSAM